LCLLASRLPVLIQPIGRRVSVRPAASAIAQHAAATIRQGDVPTTPRQWSELLHGLTKAGLVVNTDVNASQTAKHHQHGSPHLQQLLDEGVRQLPSLLRSKGAVAQDVSMTLLAYAYAGYTGDLGPVTQAVADNLEGCLQKPAPQNFSNILWALGKLCEMWPVTHQQPGVQATAYNQLLFQYAIQQMCTLLNTESSQGNPYSISNVVYSCALARHVEA
jgi:hypothetical protein